SARHWKLRIHGSTPVSGTPSRDGASTKTLATSPPRVHTSVVWAKPLIGIRCENGFRSRVTSRCWPDGDGVTGPRIAGRPISVFAPVAVLIEASWLVK